MTDNPNDLQISRIMKAPRARVWRALENSAHLSQWWCPKPWVTEVKAFDFRPGGDFHTYMSGPLPDGTTGTSDNPGCFLDIAPLERLVWTSLMVGGWRPVQSWMGISTIFTFADIDGGTLVNAVCMHTSVEDARKHADMGFEAGWGAMLAQWDAFAAGLAD